MSDNKTNWVVIIALIIVVAVLASLATVKLTGNAISVSTGKAGVVYTTSEIDSKLNSLNSIVASQASQIKNLTIQLNNTNNILNNTISIITIISNQTQGNNTIIGNWTIPGNVTLVLNQTNVYSCNDTDGGLNARVQGTVYEFANGILSRQSTDVCLGAGNSSNIIGEYYCSNNRLASANVTCASVNSSMCYSGRCI